MDTIQSKHPGLQFLILILIIGTSLIFINILGLLIGTAFFGTSIMHDTSAFRDFSNPENISLWKYLQFVNHISLFLIPALVFAILTKTGVGNFFSLKSSFPFKYALLAISILLVSLPFLNWLTSLNESLHLPAALKSFEQWARLSQDTNKQLLEAFVSTTSVSGLLINLFLMAVVPAFGEELLFRGTLQKIFGTWFKSPHAAILVTSLLFALMHMELFYVIVLFLLGVFLGYLYQWSKNLWLPISIHFLNNSIIVVLAWLSKRGLVTTDYETFGSTSNPLFITLSVIITALIIFLMVKFTEKKTEKIKNDSNPE
jgi:membrane protease YdiL (CAAX protease family)